MKHVWQRIRNFIFKPKFEYRRPGKKYERTEQELNMDANTRAGDDNLDNSDCDLRTANEDDCILLVT